MTSLFKEPNDTAVELATPEQVRQLVQHMHRESIVEKWTKARAETVLQRCQRDAKQVARRAAAIALGMDLEEDAAHERKGGGFAEREAAALAVEEALADRSVDLLAVTCASLYVLTDDDLRALASSLPALYRAPLEATAEVA